jgi:hypothetical protein
VDEYLDVIRVPLATGPFMKEPPSEEEMLRILGEEN